MYQLSTLTNKVYPELTDFYKYCRQADLDEQYRDIRPMMAVLQRVLDTNLRLDGLIQIRSTALSSFDWDIFGLANPDDNITVKKRLTEVVNNILDNHALTPLFGSTLYELGSRLTESGMQLIVNKVLDATEYDYQFPFIYIYKSDSSIEKDKIDLLTSTDYALDYIRKRHPKGNILRKIAAVEIMRHMTRREWASYLKKLKGILQVVNKGSSDQDQQYAVQAAQTAAQNNYVVTSDLMEFRLNSLTNSDRFSFKDFIESVDNEIAIAILGQANTTELPTGGGSRAALQILKMVSADIFYADMNRVEQFINTTIIPLDKKLNYGQSGPDYYFKLKISEEEDIEKNASAIKMIKDAGIPLIKEELYQRIGFTAPTAGDETI
jgi:hypothetical protein